VNIENLTGIPHFFHKAITHQDQLAFCVVVRASYGIGDDGTPYLLDEQAGPKTSDSYYGDPQMTPLREEHDRVYLKPRGEVYFVDPVAHAPGDQPMKRWPVRIRAGSIDCAFCVTGPRFYQRNLLGIWSMTDPEPCRSVPISFEHTYGGSHPEDLEDVFESNPVGVGAYLKQLKDEKRVHAPRIETPSREIPKEPIGITPVHRAWGPRRHRLGTLDEAWKSTRWPMYAKDFDPLFFQSAPDQLQLESGYFQGNEEFEIEGIGPRARTVFRLPESRKLALVLEIKESEPAYTHLDLDTVILDLETSRFDLVWRVAFMPPEQVMQAYLLFVEPSDA